MILEYIYIFIGYILGILTGITLVAIILKER